ncbi:MAG TPA: hypothetical protein VMW48_08790 [Vicinamibacterales bacterium]|nr:hypothetical protein [Vicinamibacterales bacterium]
MAKEVLHVCTAVAHPTVDIEGATHCGYQLELISSVDPGDAGEPGEVERIVTDRRLAVTLYGQDDAVLLALLEVAAANLVIDYKGAGGVAKTKTLKNVMFTEQASEVPIRAKDAGGNVPTVGIRGHAVWGANDTIALMIVTGAG